MKTPNYKELAETYEALIDIKDEIIRECEEECRGLRKQLINHKVDRITLTAIILILIVGIIFK